MLGEHAVTGRQDRFLAGKLCPIETPVGMLGQFFIPFIVLVHGVKEGFRIGNVDGNRDAEPSAFFPDGIEARVVNRNQFPRLIAHA